MSRTTKRDIKNLEKALRKLDKIRKKDPRIIVLTIFGQKGIYYEEGILKNRHNGDILNMFCNCSEPVRQDIAKYLLKEEEKPVQSDLFVNKRTRNLF